MAADLSVVIVNWNVRDLLRRCLASVYRFTGGIDAEVFVVDNASADGSVEMVQREFPQVRLIANDENRGFARANNQALRECAGRYLLLLNPDTELIDNAFKRMVEWMDSRPDAACLASKLIYPDGTVQRTCRHFPSFCTDLMEALYLDALFPRSPFFNRYRMGGWEYTGTREVDQPSGACLLVRASALERAGLMDERLFMYYDEVDLCYRIKKLGGRIYFTDTITVVHHGNASSKQAREACEHHLYASRLLFFRKQYGRCAPYRLMATLLIKSIIAWGVFGLTSLLVRKPRDPEYFRAPLRIAWEEQLAYVGRTR